MVLSRGSVPVVRGAFILFGQDAERLSMSLIRRVSIAAAAALAVALNASAAQAAPDYLSIVAGDGTSGAVLPGSALSSPIGQPTAEAVDSHGNVYIADRSGNQILKVTPAGVLSVFAGDGATGGWSAGPATATHFGSPQSLAVDSQDNVYVGVDWDTGIGKITPAGELSILGDGTYGSAVEGPISVSPMGYTYALAFDHAGNLYFSDYDSYAIFKMTPAGTLTRVAGDGTGSSGAPLAGPALNSPLDNVYGLAVDSHDNLLIAATPHDVVLKVTPGGVLSIFAGDGTVGPPVAGAATASPLSSPVGLAVDADDNVYIADTGNNVLEQIAPDGDLAIFAGTGTSGAATAGAPLSSDLGPRGLAIDANGALYTTDSTRAVKIGWTTPTAPPELIATPQSTSIGLTFQAPSDPGAGGTVTGYESSVDGGPWQTLNTSPGAGATLTATLTGLTPSHAYSVRIRGVNASGGGLASLALSVMTTAADVVAPTPTATVPPATLPGPVSACRSMRRLTVHWIVRKRDRLAKVTVSVNGKRLRTISGKARSTVIHLATGAPITYRIRIDATTITGRKLRSNRMRGFCNAKLPAHSAVRSLVLKPITT
jgi:fibronectin type III domain protein/NHL repeat-containing protein